MHCFTYIHPKALILLALLALQLFLLSFGKETFGLHGSPVFILLTGLALGFLPLTGVENASASKEITTPRWIWLLPLIGILTVGWQVSDIIHTVAIDPKASDIIPSIQHMYIDRLFAGEKIYQAYHGFGYEFQPTYLPLFWMPYIISGLLHFDHRWLAYGILVLALLTWQWRLTRKDMPAIELVLKSILPWLLVGVFVRSNPNMVGYTLETMIAGYYIWFVMSLLSRSNLKNAGGLVLTLLSRFSNLLFLPLYAWIGIREKGWKAFGAIAGIVVAAVVVIYVIPFLSSNWQAFASSYDYYSTASVFEWERPDLERPPHLYNGVGIAFWYYTFAPGDTANKLELLKYTQMVLCLLVPLLLGAWYVKQKPSIDWRFFLLCSFQVYMAIFYSFVQIPYTYLFIVPLIVATFLVSEVKWLRTDVS